MASSDPSSSTDTEIRTLHALGTLPLSELSDPRCKTLLMEGDAMRVMNSVVYQGATIGFRELASYGMVCAFNGVASGMDTRLFRTKPGRPVRVELMNRSMFAHAIHLHGYHFQIIERSGAMNQAGFAIRFW